MITMSHKATITDEIKNTNSVRIEFETVIDGEKIGVPELDGETVEGHFDIDYKKYKENSVVDDHVAMWSEHFIEKKIDEVEPSESAKGREIEI